MEHRDYNSKCAQKQNILKKALFDCPRANVTPLFNSNMTKVSVLNWSQICTRTIRSGVVVIPKYLKNACKAGYLNIFGYAKNTTSDGPTSILRPLYNRYFCHITIEKWSQVYPHIVPYLSEGTWWSSNSFMDFLGSSGAKDQLPGH